MALPAINVAMVVQIILALVIILILYIITLIVLNIDSIVVQNSEKVKPHEQIDIIRGYAPISYLGYKTYNTYNQYADNFRKISRSMNTMGGAQFTYQFWLKIDDPNDALFKDMIILLKGDDRKYKIGLYDADSKLRMSEIRNKHAIACPLIKFVDSYKHLQVQLNTTNSPGVTIDINMDPNSSGFARRNAMSLLPLSWYLLTFTFEDNFSSTNSTENGINFKFWLNDFPYQEESASNTPVFRNNAIRQNDGDLFVLPNPPENGTFLRLGNLKYFNYALNDDEIRGIFRNGPPTKSAIETETRIERPPYLTAFNKIDVYNY